MPRQREQVTFISGLANARREAESRNSRSRTREWVVIGGFGSDIYKLDSVPKKGKRR